MTCTGVLSLLEACGVVSRAEADPALADGLRMTLQTLLDGARSERNAAGRALRAFIDARIRARRIPPSEAENIASDIELKILERPELFVAAENPAAYIAVSIRYRWLTHLRSQERARRKAQREAQESALRQEAEEGDEADPLGAAEELRAARADLELAAERVVARASEDVRDQQADTWRELVDLADSRRTMDAILRAHGAAAAADGDLERDRALKVLRDRVLQRHQRMRKRMAAVIEELGDSDGWPPERVRRASVALRQLFVRCQRRPVMESSRIEG